MRRQKHKANKKFDSTYYNNMNSYLETLKLCPKIDKQKEENAVVTKLKKAAHNFLENDDIDSLVKVIKDYKFSLSEGYEIIEKENWTLESNIFNDPKTGMNLLHSALEYNKKKCSEYFISNFSVNYLLNTYTNIESQIPPSCKSCLHIIAEQGDKYLLELFLAKIKPAFPKTATTDQAFMESFFEIFHFDKIQDFMNMGVVTKVGDDKRRFSSVHLAVINGHHHLLDTMAKNEFLLDAEDDFSETPLMWSIIKKDVVTFNKLLSLGANINYTNQYNSTPVHLAITVEQLEIAEILMENPKTDLNIQRIKNPRSVVECVASNNFHHLMKKLLSPAIIKRIKEENIKEALFIAAKKGHLETMVEILTVDRSLVEATDDSVNTPVLIAADNDKVDAVRLLIEQYSADITVKNNKLQTIYDLAMRQSTSEVLQLLMQHDKSDMIVKPYYLHTAAAAGDLEKINFILDCDKVKLLDIDNNNNTIFHTAAANNAYNVLDHFLRKYDDYTDLQNKERATALHLAVRKGHLESFLVLVEKNARFDLEDIYVQNVLHAAVSSVITRPEIVQIIVEKMKQNYYPLLNSQDLYGDTALHLAVKYSNAHLIELLSDLDPEVENQDGEIPLQSAVKYGTISEVQALINTFYKSKKVNIDLKDELGHSALFMSAEKGNAEIFELLILNGANMTLRNNASCTILHRIVESNKADLVHSDKYIEVFYKIVKYSVRWYCWRLGVRPPYKNTKQFYQYQLISVRYLTNDLYYKDCNVLQYASKLGTGELLKAILRTPYVYKFTIDCSLGVGQAQAAKLKSNEISSLSEFLQCKTKPNEVLFDVSYLIPSTKPKHVELIDLESHTKPVPEQANESAYEDEKLIYRVSAKRLPAADNPGRCMTSCLEHIVETNKEEYINDILDAEFFQFLISKYWSLCRWGYEVLMWTHVLYMILFTYFIMPSREYLIYRFHPPSINENETSEIINNENFNFSHTFEYFSLFLTWPILILLYEIFLGCVFIISIKNVKIKWTRGLLGELRTNEITSGLMKLPVGVLLFLFGNLSHTSSVAFSLSALIWYLIASFTNNPHTYLESLAVVLILGWLHTITYVKGFKDWNALASILKHIFIKDIIRFIYIFVFVLISFGYAMHVLMLADYNLSSESRHSVNTLYFTFYRMLSPDNIVEITDDDKYKNSGGRVFVLRGVYAIYSVLSTVVLMNLLIAMMNSTYSDIQSMKSTAWRISTLKLALWFERHLPNCCMRRLLKFKTFYDIEENRWMLIKICEINEEKDNAFFNAVTGKDGEKEKNAREETPTQGKSVDTCGNLTVEIENLNARLDKVEKDIDEGVNECKLIRTMVTGMKADVMMEIKKIHELCLETCLLAKLKM